MALPAEGKLNVMEIMKQAAIKGGGVLRTYFGQELVVDQKKTAVDLRTKADTESEALIVNELLKHLLFTRWMARIILSWVCRIFRWPLV